MQLTKHRQHPVSQLGDTKVSTAVRTASSSPFIISRSSPKSYPGSGDGLPAIVFSSSLCVNGLRNTASNPSLSFSRRSEAETAITGNLRAQSSEAERIAESS